MDFDESKDIIMISCSVWIQIKVKQTHQPA